MTSMLSGKTKSSSSKVACSSANHHKINGNRFFYLKLFEDAVKSYDKAIELKPGESSFWTNRALSNIQLHRWSQVVDDCRSALEIDPYQAKAHVFLGHALLELKFYDQAISSLTKAEQLVVNQQLYSGDEVQSLLRLARKARQAGLEEQQAASLVGLRGLLRHLLKAKKEEMLLKRNGGNGVGEVGGVNGEDSKSSGEEVNAKYVRLEGELEVLFEKAMEQQKKRDVLDALCGKISFELMRQPVITPAGITYDRSDILQHLSRVGHFDPISRSTLTLDSLTPNHALKQFIDNYLSNNPWAEFC